MSCLDDDEIIKKSCITARPYIWLADSHEFWKLNYGGSDLTLALARMGIYKRSRNVQKRQNLSTTAHSPMVYTDDAWVALPLPIFPFLD
jgi:hypothetical protein